MSALCVHLFTIDKSFSADLISQKKLCHCDWCFAKGPELWLCLYRGCLKVGCGETELKHAYNHNQQLSSHCIAINLSNMKSWCYMCEMEVTNWVLCKLKMNPSQQVHFGSPICASGVAYARPITPNNSSEDEEDDGQFSNMEEVKSKGLVGLRNLGLTCYMNAAIQALSNSNPLCQFVVDCPAFLHLDRKQSSIVRPFHKLILDIWHEKRPPCIAPSLLYHSFRTLYPMFRLYSQQDSQEFLRYFMDQLHEELREPCLFAVDSPNWDENEDDAESGTADHDDTISATGGGLSAPQSETAFTNTSSTSTSPTPSSSTSIEAEGYETCDSGPSDDHRQTDYWMKAASDDVASQPQVKRKKKEHQSLHTNYQPLYDTEQWVQQGAPEQDQSEFSDAMSDTSLLDSKASKNQMEKSLKNKTNSLSNPCSQANEMLSTTSGLGSSISSCAGKSSLTSLHLKSNPAACRVRRRKPPRYRSIISDCFDGELVSSVQCLTCNTTSSRRENFQDLSLPIPSSDQLTLLQQQKGAPHVQLCQSQKGPVGSGVMSSGAPGYNNFYLPKNACEVASDGRMWVWIWSLWSWMRSWLWGPSVSLLNCLSAFFSADELKGDNMYSCDKCGKLRNGVKYSKVVRLPEILIIHLKRFRHEYMFSSKISQYVKFPMTGLDLSSFLHKDCSSEVRSYDLYSVICHHGAVGGGHYTAYAQNVQDGRWYDFDDQRVTEVSPENVLDSEAYVLFYKKSSVEMAAKRQRTIELMQVSSHEQSLMEFHISKQWINKFNTFSEPGPIDNSDFLCPHGGVQPLKTPIVADLVLVVGQGVWEYLYSSFGGGPACICLFECATCRRELEAVRRRRSAEYEEFVQLHTRFQRATQPRAVRAISMRWYRTWEAFVLGRQPDPPNPIENVSICLPNYMNGVATLRPGSDYAPISREMWRFFFSVYGGGPEVRCGQSYDEDEEEEEEKEVASSPSSPRSSDSLCADPNDVAGRSLSWDNLPRKVSEKLESERQRQRTLSASEVVLSRRGTTCSDDTRVRNNRPDERHVIRWNSDDDNDDSDGEAEKQTFRACGSSNTNTPLKKG